MKMKAQPFVVNRFLLFPGQDGADFSSFSLMNCLDSVMFKTRDRRSEIYLIGHLYLFLGHSI